MMQRCRVAAKLNKQLLLRGCKLHLSLNLHKVDVLGELVILGLSFVHMNLATEEAALWTLLF